MALLFRGKPCCLSDPLAAPAVQALFGVVETAPWAWQADTWHVIFETPNGAPC